MIRWIGNILGLSVFIVAGSVALWFYQDHFSAQHQIVKLEEEKRVLTRVVQRLGDEKRVAEVLVTDQKTVNGALHTRLLFVEYDRAGNALAPKEFEIEGNEAHIDALVIRFTQDFVASGDPLRGHSIALFTKIYGAKQTPAQGFTIDEPGKIPDRYRDADPRVGDFERELWQSFWKLADDPDYRAKHGVELANGQGVWGPFSPDKLYTITVQSHGGVSITSEPLKGIYREALKRRIES